MPPLTVLMPPRAWIAVVEGLARTTRPALRTRATESLSAVSWTVPMVSVPEPFLVMVPPPVCAARTMLPEPPTT